MLSLAHTGWSQFSLWLWWHILNISIRQIQFNCSDSDVTYLKWPNYYFKLILHCIKWLWVFLLFPALFSSLVELSRISISGQEWGRPRCCLLCSAFSLQNLQEAKAVCLQGFLLHIILCGFPMENIWLEGMSCVEPLECEEFGNQFFLHNSILTLQKNSDRKKALCHIPSLLSPLFTIYWGRLWQPYALLKVILVWQKDGRRGKNRWERKGVSGHTKGNLLLDSSRKKKREQSKGWQFHPI